MSIDKYNIDGHKLHLHPERIAQWLKDPLNTYPIYVEISPVGHCNHRCSFCAVDYIGYKANSLEVATLSVTLREMAYLGIKSVMFAGEGEPLLHKDIGELVRVARHSGLDVAFTTNGVLLNKLDDVLHMVDWVKVSINGGDEETYERIHKAKKGDWDKVWSNIANARNKCSTAVLGVQTVVLPDNILSIPKLIQKANEAGASYVVLKPYSQHESSRTRVYESTRYKEDKKRLQDWACNSSIPVIVRLDSMEEWDKQEHKYEKCNATPYFWAYIMATGDVYSCSAYLLNDSFNLGNINTSSFQSIWTGEKRSNHIINMRNLDISGCRLNCRMNKVNKYLDQVINKPEHGSFI